jgi:hypothetical protein
VVEHSVMDLINWSYRYIIEQDLKNGIYVIMVGREDLAKDQDSYKTCSKSTLMPHNMCNNCKSLSTLFRIREIVLLNFYFFLTFGRYRSETINILVKRFFQGMIFESNKIHRYKKKITLNRDRFFLLSIF